MRRPILLVGAGRMGGALLKGWVAADIAPLIVIEPAPSPQLRQLARTKKIGLYRQASEVRGNPRACVVALKPQILRREASQLENFAQQGAVMISIAAGITTKALVRAWGKGARVVRAMPNIPGSIGKGISALYAGRAVRAADRKLAESLLSPLGQILWIKRELLIDSITAISGSGPAYVFLLVEALAAAARTEGLSRPVAEQLARATVVGAGALLDLDARSTIALRKDVTSLGGTTQAALEVLLKENGFTRMIAQAVQAARKRAEALGRDA